VELNDSDDSEVLAAVERSRASRKRKSTSAADKAKAAKKKKRASKSVKDEDDDSFSGGDDPLSYASRKAKKPPLSTPGQLANCEVCDKRFTVTPYSKTGPDGGLLCGPCSKQLAAETKKDKPKAKKPARKGRRQVYSNLLDGVVQRGAFSLLDMCIKVRSLCPPSEFRRFMNTNVGCSALRITFMTSKNSAICLANSCAV
jgi:DNA repair protein RAD7